MAKYLPQLSFRLAAAYSRRPQLTRGFAGHTLVADGGTRIAVARTANGFLALNPDFSINYAAAAGGITFQSLLTGASTGNIGGAAGWTARRFDVTANDFPWIFLCNYDGWK
jgi:hypothetical protein